MLLKKIKSIIKNPYIFSVISKILVVLVGFLFTVFQSRFLGPEIKGQVATLTSITSIASIALALGTYQAYPYYRRTSKEDVLPIFLKINLLMLGAYLLLAAALVLIFDFSEKYTIAILVSPLLAFDSGISYITLVEQPNRKNSFDIVVSVAELVLVIVLWIFAKPSFILGVFIITIKDIFKAFVFAFWWRKRTFVKTEPILQWFPRLVKFGIFPMLSLLMTMLNYRVDVLMLDGKVADAAIGIYSVGVQLAERIWMLPDAMKGVLVSNITKGKGKDEVVYIIRVCNTICLIIAAGIIALGKPFITLLFGKAFSKAYQVTLIMLLGIFPMIYYKMIGSYNIAQGKRVVNFVFLSISVVINVIANYLMIPIWGIYGAGMASVISYSLCSILFIVYFCKNEQVKLREMLFLRRSEFKQLKTRLLNK